MGVLPNAGGGALSITEGLDSGVWAQHEFGHAPLGDARLTRAPGECGSRQSRSAWTRFLRRGQGPLARYQGLRTYYSLIDSPAESAVTLPNILELHRARTVRRMMGQKVVLCVQDGSDLNYNTLDGCEDLGVIGSNQTGARVAACICTAPWRLSSSGLPLGVLRADCTAPQEKSKTEERMTGRHCTPSR